MLMSTTTLDRPPKLGHRSAHSAVCECFRADLLDLFRRVRAGVDSVAAAARAGDLHVDDELHLAALAADEEDPKVTRLRTQLDQRIGEVQLPEVILAVDA